MVLKLSVFSILTISSLLLFSCGGGGFKNPAAYNNELMTVINDNEKHVNEMNAAMTSADYNKASEVRTSWEASLKEKVKKVEGIGDYKGDKSLQQAVLDGLKAFQKIVTDDYPKLIDIRKSGKEDPAEQMLLSNINNVFHTAGSAVNVAAAQFATKHAK